MDDKYFPGKIEKKWRERWADVGTFTVEVSDPKPKFYCLEMLPYPSGRLHIGHVRNYAIGDAMSWYMRLRGFNVLHPIGWDSFGQPAEQAAIQQGVNPREWTEKNIEQMRSQLKSLGIGYDWEREIAAHRPEYYKFDQWFFLKMLEMGLAYRKDAEVNWCPKCETTLSNEQASGGICWRCGNQVEKQSRPQWFLKITDYAQQLLDDMKELEEGWPDRVLTMQRNWIGRSDGAFIEFRIAQDGNWSADQESIRVFTTRIDTVYGVNAIIVAPEHPLIAENREVLPDDVRKKLDEIGKERAKPAAYGEEIEKDGIDTGIRAVNPFDGNEVPVWVGNYVMMDYGTGAVMSVPAHDERDLEFTFRFGLPFRRVVFEPGSTAEAETDMGVSTAFTGKGELRDCGRWSGLGSEEAIVGMTAFAEEKGFGESAVTYKLRDWGISRQRFWGAPIPIIYCGSCGIVPVPFSDLPVELPDSAPFTGEGESPLNNVAEFVNADCPGCGGSARRETDTMDTFVDSTWYYFRYCDPRNPDLPFDKEIVAHWFPVDLYIGGIDHAVMHLLYTRFWTKMMRDIGLTDFGEPVKRMLTQGMVVAESFYSTAKESYVVEDEVDVNRDENGKIINASLSIDGSPVRVAVEKMGKSKLNGVDPDDMISVYGSDAVRIFALFAAPAENELVWQESGIEGAVRFLQRVWRHVLRWRGKVASFADGKRFWEVEPPETPENAVKLRRKTHQTISKITRNLENGQFNTPVAALMELSNALGDYGVDPDAAADGEIFAAKEAIEGLLLMLAPYAPHFSEELWEAITGHEDGILASGALFPKADESLTRSDEIEIAIQVNGKLRSRMQMPPDASDEEMRSAAMADPRALKFTGGKEPIKTIVVPGRLVNIVVGK